MDDALWLQVKVPARDLQGFLDRSPFHGASLHTNDQLRLSDFREFYATPPLRCRGGQQELPNGRVLNLLIDESDAANFVVYLMCHET
jgi:hypothetical protein